MKLRCPHIKQIKTVYEAQFSTDSILNDENLKKNIQLKKQKKQLK
jgi:hypothetical protein